jgi:hypothetical protein
MWYYIFISMVMAVVFTVRYYRTNYTVKRSKGWSRMEYLMVAFVTLLFVWPIGVFYYVKDELLKF